MKDKFDDYFIGIRGKDLKIHNKEVARVRKNRRELLRVEAKRIIKLY